MIIKEYRVVLPMTVADYQVAQLFSVAEASMNETGGGEGIEILKNEPYEERDGQVEKGQYTHKIYHLQSRVPSLVNSFVSSSNLQMIENAWNAYPKCKTVVTNPYFADMFEISVETLHLPDCGTTENAHGLSQEEWKQTEVVKIDIANDPVSSNDYKKEFDPALVQFEKAPQQALGKQWIDEAKMNGVPMMCAYKLVKCRFNKWGFQTVVENMIHQQQRRLFTTFHRRLFCWMDKWYGMTMEDIRRLEDETKAELAKMIKEGEVRGTKVE